MSYYNLTPSHFHKIETWELPDQKDSSFQKKKFGQDDIRKALAHKMSGQLSFMKNNRLQFKLVACPQISSAWVMSRDCFQTLQGRKKVSNASKFANQMFINQPNN